MSARVLAGVGLRIYRGGEGGGRGSPASSKLAFTRYSFTSRPLCTNQPSFHSPRPPALPILVQYYCTIIWTVYDSPPDFRLHAIHHTILVITISCKGHPARLRSAARPKPLVNPSRMSAPVLVRGRMWRYRGRGGGRGLAVTRYSFTWRR